MVRVVREVENNLLKRKEVEVEIQHIGKSTPSRKELVAELAKQLSGSEDTIIVKKIHGSNTVGHSVVQTFLYNKKEDVPKSLSDFMDVRISGKKPKSQEAAAKPAK